MIMSPSVDWGTKKDPKCPLKDFDFGFDFDGNTNFNSEELPLYYHGYCQ